jgi:hypothetical protein
MVALLGNGDFGKWIKHLILNVNYSYHPDTLSLVSVKLLPKNTDVGALRFYHTVSEDLALPHMF